MPAQVCVSKQTGEEDTRVRAEYASGGLAY